MSSSAIPDDVVSTPSTPTTNTSGGRNNQFKKGNNTHNAHIIKQVKFEGRSDAMKGHVYDCNDAKQSD
jgi:hypothetical protein